MSKLKNNLSGIAVGAFLIGSLTYAGVQHKTPSDDQYKAAEDYNFENVGEIENSYSGYDSGYEWAVENDPSNFDDCQTEFGTSEAEDGCNDYVKENYSGFQTFGGYECTEDCSGHEAGFEWAVENGIDDEDDCDGNSQSFIEGCYSFVEENY